MSRRRFSRSAGACAGVAGATGIAANAALIGYFVLAAPWEPGHNGRWEWLGPANDIVGSVSMVALIPVIAYLRHRVPGDRLLAALSVGGVLAAGASAVAGPLLVAGVITLPTQFVVAGVGLPVIFGWLWRANRAAARAGVLPRRTARFGDVIAIAALGATGLAGIGAALPAGSVGQYVVLALVALPGLAAYLAFPVWQIAAGRTWWRDARSGAPTGVTPALGAVPR